jgi:hypothetical protein
MKKELRYYTDEKGRTQVTMALSEKPEDELCDFCSALKPPYKIYDCPDFPHPMAPMQWSRGAWNACTGCAPYIDADDQEGLFERSGLKGMHFAGDLLRAFQGEFFKRRFRSAPPEPKSGQLESPE